MSRCLKTVGEIVKRLLVTFTRVVDRGRNVRHFLDVQIRSSHARSATDAKVSGCFVH